MSAKATRGSSTGACILAVFLLGLAPVCAEDLASYSSEDILTKITTEKLTPRNLDNYGDLLAEKGAAAAGPILAAFRENALTEAQQTALIRALGRIEGDAGVEALGTLLDSGGRIAQYAIAALGESAAPRAKIILLDEYVPAGTEEKLSHIKALRKMEDEGSTRRLADYLTVPDLEIAAPAQKMLTFRIQDGRAATLPELLRAATDRFRRAAYPSKAIRAGVADYIGRVAAALPPEKGDKLLADLLDSGDADLPLAVLTCLRRNTDRIAGSAQLIGAVDRLLRNAETGPKTVVAALDLLAASGGKEAGIRWASYFLDSESMDVRMQAAKTLESLTRLNYGRNPTAWIAWRDKTGEFEQQ